MVFAVDINLLEVRKWEKGEKTHSWDTCLLFTASISSFLAYIHIWFGYHVPFAGNVSISLRLSSPLLSLTYHLSHVDFMSSPQPIRACISEIGNYIPFLCVWEQTALQIAFPALFFFFFFLNLLEVDYHSSLDAEHITNQTCKAVSLVTWIYNTFYVTGKGLNLSKRWE